MIDEPTAAARFTRRHWVLLACLLACTLGTRLARLGTPGDLYWDEVYFGFTAREYLAGSVDAYNPWATPPPDRAYEWTHPPLGKLIMAGTMAVTSQSVWGMRLSSVLFGTAGVGLVVFIAFLLTRCPRAGLLAGLLYAADGLNFVQSRIATMDIHETGFILASLAFYIAWRRGPATSNWLLVGVGAMAGAALATKWVALFLIALIGADLLILWIILRRRHGLRTILTAGACLGALPLAIYMASYIHYFFVMGYHWADFVELQRQMWFYHTGLKATQAYQSVPWQWLLNLRPMWMYVDYVSENRIANIYNLGNSVVFYFGLIAVAIVAIKAVRRRQWEAAFLVAAYLAFWLPWVRSPRIMFSYHYLPSTAFLCAACGWVLSCWLAGRRRALRGVAWTLPPLAVAWFIVFYPNMTAIPVPTWWADAVYFAIKSWR